ncbi:hypothetical protein V5279_12490 [Bradyrhizobium sp. 26S5]|uniref:hypothetical protein n=1 Tax=Bradyrhizobium sp. 26S5 TaxID=3139729 RepID=UPI0030CDC2FC
MLYAAAGPLEGRQIFRICKTAEEAEAVADELRAAGFSNVSVRSSSEFSSRPVARKWPLGQMRNWLLRRLSFSHAPHPEAPRDPA